MTLNKHGSVFILAVTLLCCIFILGFAFTFFTGHEDYSSAMSYESEVAFNLAESAIEELVARLKNSLNHDDSSNQLYKVLRLHNLDVSKEIPLDSTQIANLTSLTRQIANEEYGILFNRGLTDSQDFKVEAVLKLENIKPVEASSGETVLYKLKQDNKEKQGELQVTATISYRGHEAKVKLNFLLRCVKTFVPPFNYFTLFVRDSTLLGNSDFNGFKSSFGIQKNMLRLDNGWRFIDPNFDAIKDANDWAKKLSELGNDAYTPPGRVYLGEDPLYYSSLGSSIPSMVRITNGSKVLPFLNKMEDTNSSFPNSFNSMDSIFLRLDVPNWTRMDDYRDDWIIYQGQVEKESETSTHGKILTFFGIDGWSKEDDKCEVRTLNVGSGIELREPPPDDSTAPTFGNLLNSFFELINGLSGYEAFQDPEISGFHPFGVAEPVGNPDYIKGSPISAAKISPTLVYGNAMTQYYRVSQIKTTKTKEIIDLPYASDSAFLQAQMMSQNYDNKKFGEKDKMTASQAYYLFKAAGLPDSQTNKIKKHWDEFPGPLRMFKIYRKFMSDSGSEFYNKGLAHLLEKANSNYTKKDKDYEGDLSQFVEFPLENDPNYPYYSQLSGDFKTASVNISQNSPMREFYEGSLMYAMPDPGDEGLPGDLGDLYLYDFYFIPRSTEDFFRGRKTVAIGGQSFDRFDYKYISDVQQYKSGVSDQVLELNGILALNDREPLGLLHNLRFKGHGIIYSSPMMGGGEVVISGNLVGEDFEDESAFKSQIGNNLLTIIAPQIVIDTTEAPGSRCYIEANLMSLKYPLVIRGDKPFTIKGSVVTTRLNLDRRIEDPNYYEDKGIDFKQNPEKEPNIRTPGENIIMYNPLNGIWRNAKPDLMDSLYVAKIVTGGVSQFDWKYER